MFAREQNRGSLWEEFDADLTFFIRFLSASLPEVHATGQQALSLTIEPLPDGVGIVDADAVHLAPGVGCRLKLRVLAAHLVEFLIEVVLEKRLDVLGNEALARGRDVVPRLRILLLGVRDGHRRQPFPLHVGRSPVRAFPEHGNDAGIAHRLWRKLNRTAEMVHRPLGDEGLQFDIDNKLTHAPD